VILLSHPTANQNVRQAALAFAENGLLSEFWTCLHWKDDGFFDRYCPTRVRRELRRRSFSNQLEPFIRTLPWREAGRLLSQQLGLRFGVPGQELHVVDHQEADGLIPLAQPVRLAARDRRMELAEDVVERDGANDGLRTRDRHLVADGFHQVRLAQPRPCVDEQRVVDATGRVGDGASRRDSEAVAGSDDEIVEAEFWI